VLWSYSMEQSACCAWQ